MISTFPPQESFEKTEHSLWKIQGRLLCPSVIVKGKPVKNETSSTRANTSDKAKFKLLFTQC